jgi:hypothetical protein
VETRIFWAIGAWLMLGALLGLLWAAMFIKDWLRDRKVKNALKLARETLIPFTAGRMTLADGGPRGDAFGFRFKPDERLPKTGAKIWVFLGGKTQRFTVAAVECLTMLGTGDAEKGEPQYQRSPEVYVLVMEKLSDAQILQVKKHFGGASFADNRKAVLTPSAFHRQSKHR